MYCEEIHWNLAAGNVYFAMFEEALVLRLVLHRLASSILLVDQIDLVPLDPC